MKLNIKEVSYHRNGVCGEGFNAVLFTWRDEDGKLRNMVASVFDGAGQCAVYDVDELKAGNIAFASGNSWRGDHYEGELRKAIRRHNLNRAGRFGIPQNKAIA